MPPNYEQIFQPDHSTMKGVVVRDLSHHSLSQTLGKQATKALTECDRGKAPMMEENHQFFTALQLQAKTKRRSSLIN
ncbi:hypothetical protein PVK06_035716 [Gossypium arboreum]|uniref:Uncharacterized protein n=1 Tax=Gossypium arboreum TaxID=29729 RepID=A0ABR0NHZ0_GOSAR|nr:hypothetical protein PVK06_035716 [Gossypium arboreum]